jgi:hypothetical protein
MVFSDEDKIISTMFESSLVHDGCETAFVVSCAELADKSEAVGVAGQDHQGVASEVVVAGNWDDVSLFGSMVLILDHQVGFHLEHGLEVLGPSHTGDDKVQFMRFPVSAEIVVRVQMANEGGASWDGDVAGVLGLIGSVGAVGTSVAGQNVRDAIRGVTSALVMPLFTAIAFESVHTEFQFAEIFQEMLDAFSSDSQLLGDRLHAARQSVEPGLLGFRFGRHVGRLPTSGTYAVVIGPGTGDEGH